MADIVSLDNLANDESINTSQFKLYNKEVLELSRNTLLFQDYKKIDKLMIEKPYSYVMDNGLEDVVNLNFYSYDNNVYKTDDSKCAKAFHLNYISGHIDNKNYDLEKSLEILKSRDDIHLYSNDIEKVPYYNADDADHKCLDFKWSPTDEDFDKIKDLSSFKAYDYIAKEILKLPSIEIYND